MPMSKKKRCSKIKTTGYSYKNHKKYWEGVFKEIEADVKQEKKLTVADLKKFVSGQMYESLQDILFGSGEDLFLVKNIQCFAEQPEKHRTSKLSDTQQMTNEESSLEVLLSEESKEGREGRVAFSEDSSSESLQDVLEPVSSDLDSALPNTTLYVTKSLTEHNRKSSKKIATFDFEAYQSEENIIDPKPKDFYEVYNNFFKKSNEEAAIWRPRRQKAYEEMTLAEKSHYITHKISNDFIEWMKQVKPTECMNLTLENLMHMFDIGADSKSTPIDLRMNELPCVPKNYANFKNLPVLCKDACLLREMVQDIEASQAEPKLLAFGSQISATRQVRPNLNDVAAKWHQARCGREDIVTMEAVWKGITDLSSTQGFVEYLKTKPEIVPPKYLVTEGLFDKKMSSETTTSTKSTKVSDNTSL